MLRALAGRCRLIRDSRGKPSWTHTLAIPFSVLTMLKWLLGGVVVVVHGATVTIPTISAGDAAIILGVWLAYLAQRDYKVKRIETANAEVQSPAMVKS